MKTRLVAPKRRYLPGLKQLFAWRPIGVSASFTRFALGFWVLLSLFVLNGDMGTLSRAWLQRLTVSVVELSFVCAFLSRMRPNIWRSDRYLTLLAFVSTLSLLGVRLCAVAIGPEAFEPIRGFLGFAPIIAGGILIANLISPTIAIIGLTLATMSIAWAGSFNLQAAVAGLIGGWSGILTATPLRNRQLMIQAGAILSLVIMALSAGFAIEAGNEWRSILNAGGWGIVSGIGAIALFWLGTALVERPFRLDTPLLLLELSSPEHPLLKRLREEAPGTYAHSLNVGMLAEAGAQAIGADPLLARAGGYYHDIGKLRRPTFFIENQTGINSHERLTPNLSATIIAAHVKDGIELAQAHRLPIRVCGIIAQHHGTSLITYFYHQAMGDGKSDPILEQHFRYEGPKPHSREAALVMLADTVEAASRCLDSPSPSRLTNFVHDLLEMRRADSQLNESDLTFRDLAQIEEAFVRTLSAIHHQRVDYAEAKEPKPETYAIQQSM
jgi:putative nucleotidyltransferase with HDIG domain